MQTVLFLLVLAVILIEPMEHVWLRVGAVCLLFAGLWWLEKTEGGKASD